MRIFSYVTIAIFLSGCFYMPLKVVKGYHPLAEISDSGFLNDNNDYQKYNGKTVSVWGYLDIDNSSLNRPSYQKELFFNLKSRYENSTGESVKVVCQGGKKAYQKIFTHLEQIGEFGKERIFVRGTVLLQECPTNFFMNYCVLIKVDNPQDIHFGRD
jgi:hypothetical protein